MEYARIIIITVHREFGTYGRYVFRWELICRVRYEQTSLADGAVADDHALDGLHFAAATTTLERNQSINQSTTDVQTLVTNEFDSAREFRSRIIGRAYLLYAL